MIAASAAPFALRAVAVALAVGAAFGPRVAGSQPVARFVLVDVSAGCDVAAASLSGLADGLHGGSVRLATYGDGVVRTWGGAPRDATDWRELFRRGGLPPSIPRAGDSATSLAEALAHAAREGAGPDTGHLMEVVVVTDMRSTSTDEDLARAATELRRAGCDDLSFVELPARVLPPHIVAVRGPGRVRSGDAFGIRVEGRSGPRGGAVELVQGGVITARRPVAGGPFRVVFPCRADAPGERVYEARIDGATGPRAPRAHVVVGEAGRTLLLVDGTPRAGLVPSFGDRVDVATPDVEELATLLATHELVVVDAGVSEHAERLIGGWVVRGGGVVLLDGPDSALARGGVLAAAAPLRATPPDDSGTFLYVAVDGSGSMAERWPGGVRTRDDVVRAAVRAVLDGRPSDVTVALRRFNDRLLPAGAQPWVGRATDDPGAVITGWSSPGGGTVLAPVLREAARLARERTDRTRRALVFTDGRFADASADLRDAVREVVAAGCALTVVIDSADAHAALAAVLASGPPDVQLVLVDDAVALDTALRVASNGGGGEILENPALRRTPAGAAVPGFEVPAAAARGVRRWPRADATVWAETTDAVPFAAIRRHGEGRVAALATRPCDPERLADGPAARALLGTLAAWARRSVSGDVRVERSGARLTVRAVGITPTDVEVVGGDGVATRVALVPAAGGLLEATLNTDRGGLVRLLDTNGAELWAGGLDRRGPPELDRESAFDPEALTRLASGGDPGRGVSLQPWLAALAVLALVAAHAIARTNWSSRRGVLPI